MTPSLPPYSPEAAPGWLPPAFAADWPRLTQASRYLREQSLRANPLLIELAAQGVLERADGDGALMQRVGSLAPALGAAEAMTALRQRRHAEMVRIMIRDWCELAPLEETLRALSDLAEACLSAALNYADAQLRIQHGQPMAEDGTMARPIVLGMGKLGGHELNFSSDIDLIFAYTAAGTTDGARPLSNGEYFTRLVHEVVRLLASITEHGFVFRVDTLLRPFGSAGAVALSTEAMERYYEQHGREWERYAMIKARPVAGDLIAGRVLLLRLQPFVYRRYLDFGALGALRDLKRLIDQDAKRHGAENNLKLGPGGIRELEFIVQLFQLTRGGHDARLRDTRLRPVLHHLSLIGLLSSMTAAALDAAYVWLRRCENAVQMYGDEQTHRVPAEPERQAALCAALSYPDWAAFSAALEQIRKQVRDTFEQLFTEPVRRGAEDESAALTLWSAEPDALVPWLATRGFHKNPAAVAQVIDTLRRARMVRTLSDTALVRLRDVVALLVEQCAGLANPETAVERTLGLVHSIVGRSTYLALLNESATARAQLTRLCAASPWIAALLTQTPALLDALLDPRLAREAPDRQELMDTLASRAAGIPVDDLEGLMDLLRRYRQEMTLRIAAADLAGSLALVKVSDRLTWLAEAIVTRALAAAQAQLATQYGEVRRRDGEPGAFAIIAYGKFGSIELGYGSDLDLVFVYDTDDADASTEGGLRSLAAAEYFMRLAQRIVQLLSAQTATGRAYEIDLQLRPSGNSGLAVTRLGGFARYQREQAWTWEHQALLRARVVAGAARLTSAITEVRREVLTRPRDSARLREEVAAMREKMRVALERRESGRWDVKQGVGGLIDAEFLTQYLCLRHARDYPSLVEFSDNWRQLDALAAAAIINLEQRDVLITAGRAYRGFLHRRALQQQDCLAENTDFVSERAAVAAMWRIVIGVAF